MSCGRLETGSVLRRAGAFRTAPRLRRILLAGVAAAVIVGSACAAEPDLEQRYRDRAEALIREARWYDAAVQWEVLRLLRPDRGEYGRKMEEARGRARDAATQRARTAAEARQRGDWLGSVQLYLQALSEDPGYSEAARALRELEKEQLSRGNTRSLAHLSNGEAAGTRSAPRRAVAPSAAQGRELESAVMLLHQGDYELSAKMLELHLRRYPNDELASRTLREAYAALGRERVQQGKKEEALTYLQKAQSGKPGGAGEPLGSARSLRKDIAQDYYERGVRAQRTNLDEAIRLWQQALQYDPELTQARLRIEQARRMRENLDAIQGGEKP